MFSQAFMNGLLHCLQILIPVSCFKEYLHTLVKCICALVCFVFFFGGERSPENWNFEIKG